MATVVAKLACMPEAQRTGYVPALAFDWLTPAYDFVVGTLIPEQTIKSALVQGAAIEPGHRVLDVGCGTGTLCFVIKRAHPATEVVGIDGDPNILDIARGKAKAAGADVAFDEGLASKLPYDDVSFDRVFSTLALHHLTAEERAATAREIFRVLRPNGGFHIADFGRPHNALMQVLSWGVRWFDGAERLADNVAGRIPDVLRATGFADAREDGRFATAFGTVSLYRARKPAT